MNLLPTIFGHHGTPQPDKQAGVKMSYIDSGFYRISDRVAGKLALTTAAKRLPKHGYQVDVILPDGRKATMQRTSLQFRTDSPKRGWVWSLFNFH